MGTKKLQNKLVAEISKMELDSFLGLITFLGVNLMQEDEKTPKDAIDMIAEAVNNFSTLSKSKQREIVEVAKDANRA